MPSPAKRVFITGRDLTYPQCAQRNEAIDRSIFTGDITVYNRSQGYARKLLKPDVCKHATEFIKRNRPACRILFGQPVCVFAILVIEQAFQVFIAMNDAEDVSRVTFRRLTALLSLCLVDDEIRHERQEQLGCISVPILIDIQQKTDGVRYRARKRRGNYLRDCQFPTLLSVGVNLVDNERDNNQCDYPSHDYSSSFAVEAVFPSGYDRLMNPLKFLFSLLLMPIRILNADNRNVDAAYKAVLQKSRKYTPDFRREALGKEIADSLDDYINSEAELAPDERTFSKSDSSEYEYGRDLTEGIYYSGPKAAEDGLRRLREKLVLEESFSPYLVRLLREKGLDHVSVYKKAGIDRKLFSKIISRPEYTPSKKTVLALAISMEMDIDETRVFLEKAGYALSKSILTDVIVTYFISRGIHDMSIIAKALDCYGRNLKSRAEADNFID